MKLVLFDCDGTLVDSHHNITRAMRDAFEAMGQPYPGDAETRKVIGLSLPQAMEPLAPEAGPERHKALSAAYREAFFALRSRPDFHEPLFPGAREAIETLHGRAGVVLGVVTGKARRGLDMLLERFGLRAYFATLQTADDAPSKPHPGMVLRAMEETGAQAARTVVIGDTTHDMLMAKNAGAHGLGVEWGYHAPQTLLESGAEAIARDFKEAPGLVDKLIPAGES